MNIQNAIIIVLLFATTMLCSQDLDENFETLKDCLEESIFELVTDPNDFYNDYDKVKEPLDTSVRSIYFFSQNKSLGIVINHDTLDYWDLNVYGFAKNYDGSMNYEDQYLSDSSPQLVYFNYYSENDSIGERPYFARGFWNCKEMGTNMGQFRRFYRRKNPKELDYVVYEILDSLNRSIQFDVIGEFLRFDMRSICVPRLDVYDSIDGTKQGYLIEGDLVEVLEEQGDWVHVRYLKTDVEYWTYGACLE